MTEYDFVEELRLFMNNMIQENKTKSSDAVKGIGEEILDWIESLIVSLFIVMLIFTFVFRQVSVIGESMEPTLTGMSQGSGSYGDRLLISNLFYKPEVNDIVVIRSKSLNENIIKRVIAVAGQEIDIDFNTGDVYVDGELRDEPFIKEPTSKNDGAFEYPIVIPEGYVFVMGDNRNNSTDSRSPYVGLVSTSDILGKAFLRIFPFDSFGGLYNSLEG